MKTEEGKTMEKKAEERYPSGEQMIWRDPRDLPDGMSGYIETYPLTREAFISGAKWQAAQQEGWIDVKDRLPEEGKRVFIYYKNDYGKYWRDIATYTTGGKIEFDDENESWPECFDEKAGCSFLPEGFWVNDGDEEKTFARNNVTHWMPLPPAPPQSINQNKE